MVKSVLRAFTAMALLSAGTAYAQNSSPGPTVESCVTPTVTTANAYGINFVVGGLLTFQVPTPFPPTGGGVLQSVNVTIAKVETSGFTFFPFSAQPTASTWTDAAVANITGADIKLQRSPISLTGNSQLGTATIASAVAVGQALRVGSGNLLYGILLSNAALTNNFTTAGDVQVCVEVLQDP